MTMNRSGLGPQSLSRGPSNVFQAPQNPPQRQAAGSLGSGRLQNGKLGGATGQNWGFGLGAATTLGAQSTSQSRNPGLSGFAQAIGSGQSQASLDLSAFPSLPGAPQGQQPQPLQQQQQPPVGLNSSSNWPPSNSNSRTHHESQIHRLQGPSSQQNHNAHTIPTPPQLHSSRQRPSESSSHTSVFGHPTDDFRFSQAPSRMSDMQGGGEEFPPLGGLGSDQGPIRRELSGSTVVANGGSNGTSFPYGPPPLPQHDRSGQTIERMFPTLDGSRGTPTLARSPLDHGEPEDFSRLEQTSGGRMSRSSVRSNFSYGQMPYRSNPVNQLGDAPRLSQRNPSQNNSSMDRPAAAPMSELDRWGLAGLAERLSGGQGADMAALALGMDLNTLGLDLNRPDNAPLHTTWAGPFADPTGPPLRTDYRLPPAYFVKNVPPIEQRISQFTDETLFLIFYTQTRDIAQIMAADELYRRDWRWHKERRQWMMKDKDSGEPRAFPDRNSEHGVYMFFDVNQWDMTKSEFHLRYEDLYHPPEASMPNSLGGGRDIQR